MPNKDRSIQLESQRRHYRENREDYAQRQRERRDAIREYLDNIRKANKCKKCGLDDYRLLCFHHRNPDEKEVVAHEFFRCKWSFKRIDAELAKCDILCHHCHILLHWELRQNEQRVEESGTSRTSGVRDRGIEARHAD